MGGAEFQIFLGLAVVLGGAFIALICDLLKGDNEHLRATNIALRVRHDEMERSSRMVHELRAQAVEVVLRDRMLRRRKGRKSAGVAEAAPTPKPGTPGSSGLVVVVGKERDSGEIFEALVQNEPGAQLRETGPDDLVVFFPGETGPAARIRMQWISTRIWECELKASSGQQVSLCWGAAVCNAEPLENAVNYARERMIETRLRRKALLTQIPTARRRAASA